MNNQNIAPQYWGWPFALGIILIILGIAAISAPYFATIASMIFLGWLLVFGGIAQIAFSFISRASSSFLLHALLGLFSIVIGGLIIAFPSTTALTLTVLLVAFFLALGLFRIFTSIALRFENWGWFLASGILAVVLGVLILIHWPSSALWVIGLFIGIDFIFVGWSFVALSLFMKKLAPH